VSEVKALSTIYYANLLTGIGAGTALAIMSLSTTIVDDSQSAQGMEASVDDLLKPDEEPAAGEGQAGDDDDLEALRMAALNSIKPKKPTYKLKKHPERSNLLAIVPVDEDKTAASLMPKVITPVKPSVAAVSAKTDEDSWEEYSEYETDSEAEREEDARLAKAKAEAEAEKARRKEEQVRQKKKAKAANKQLNVEEEGEDVLSLHVADEMDDLLNEFEVELDSTKDGGQSQEEDSQAEDLKRREKQKKRVVKKRKKVKKPSQLSSSVARGQRDSPRRDYPSRRRSPLLPLPPRPVVDFSQPPPGYYAPTGLPLPPPRGRSPPPYPPRHSGYYGRGSPYYGGGPPSPYRSSSYSRSPPPRGRSPYYYSRSPSPPRGWRRSRSPQPHMRRRSPLSPRRSGGRRSGSPPPPRKGDLVPHRGDSAPRRLDDKQLPLSTSSSRQLYSPGKRSKSPLDDLAKSRSLPPKAHGGSSNSRGDYGRDSSNGAGVKAEAEDRRKKEEASEKAFQEKLDNASSEERKRMLARREKFSRPVEGKGKVISLKSETSDPEGAPFVARKVVKDDEPEGDVVERQQRQERRGENAGPSIGHLCADSIIYVGGKQVEDVVDLRVQLHRKRQAQQGLQPTPAQEEKYDEEVEEEEGDPLERAKLSTEEEEEEEGEELSQADHRLTFSPAKRAKLSDRGRVVIRNRAEERHAPATKR